MRRRRTELLNRRRWQLVAVMFVGLMTSHKRVCVGQRPMAQGGDRRDIQPTREYYCYGVGQHTVNTRLTHG